MRDRCQALHQRCADLGLSAAAVLNQEQDQLLQSFDIGLVGDVAALAFADDEPRVRQDREMVGKGVLRNANEARQFACSDAVRLLTDQSTKRIQARVLGQRAKCLYRFNVFHISRDMEITGSRRVRCKT